MPLYELQLTREAMVAANITIEATSEEEAINMAKIESLKISAEDWYTLDHEFYKDHLDIDLLNKHT